MPLLVLTADRPPELRDIGAGQTIDQIKLYGSAAKWFFEVDDYPASPVRVRWLRQLACRAFWTAVDGRPGPVHLNFSFREPLVPDGPSGVPDVEVVAGPRRRPAVGDAAAGAARRRSGVARRAGGRARGAAAGAWSSRGGPSATRGWARRWPRSASAAAFRCWPIRCRARAAGRPRSRTTTRCCGTGVGGRSAGPRAAGRRPPDLQAAAAWLAGLGRAAGRVRSGERVAGPGGLGRHDRRRRPAARRSTRSPSGCRSAARTRPGWTRWHAADRRAAGAIAAALGPAGCPSRAWRRNSASLLPDDATLVVASSMPVRDVETFFPARPARSACSPTAGANGIDGTVSTAFGVAAAARGPVVLLIGDVALAHDVGGLLAASRLGLRLVIVLIDNDGGGIFNFLPAAGEGDGVRRAHRHAPRPGFLPRRRFVRAAAGSAPPTSSRSAPRWPPPWPPTAARSSASAPTATENVDLHARVWESVRTAT